MEKKRKERPNEKEKKGKRSKNGGKAIIYIKSVYIPFEVYRTSNRAFSFILFLCSPCREEEEEEEEHSEDGRKTI